MDKTRMSSSSSMATNSGGSSRQLRKLAYRSRHRLLSIDRDSKGLKQRVLSALSAKADSTSAIECVIWPWLPNKQCGSWYLPPSNSNNKNITAEVYFKSTDGHVGTYAISLKRLNLPLLELLHKVGGCFLVDSSVRKILPDSFSRTIPIWCCVINRIVLRYRREFGDSRGCDDGDDIDCNYWDTRLYTPLSIVSPEEHAEISDLIDSRVELLYESGAIVDPSHLLRVMTKPVRAIWVANGSLQRDTISIGSTTGSDNQYSSKFFTIVCCNPSYYDETRGDSKNHVKWVDISEATDVGYYYTPGAADDDATWGRGLSAELFWANRERIIDGATSSISDDEMDALIDSIVNEYWLLQQIHHDNDHKSPLDADKIGDTNLWIGSRGAGRPPECWTAFDAILNVTETEYPSMQQSIKQQEEIHHKLCFYLQLPVEEGKRDKYELERWMAVGLVFLIKHLQHHGRCVLVHCDHGRDRSVGIILAFIALFCLPEFPLRMRPEFESLDIECITELTEQVDRTDAGGENNDNIASKNHGLYLHSGLSSSLVNSLLDEKNGRDIFLKWMHQWQNEASMNIVKPLADKESLRIVLHLLRGYRENAEPTRSTMQKLNRFFMSSSIYRIKN